MEQIKQHKVFKDKYGETLDVGDIVLMNEWRMCFGIVTRFTPHKIGVMRVQDYNALADVAERFTYQIYESLLNRTNSFVRASDALVYAWPNPGIAYQVMKVKAEVMTKKEIK